METATENEYRIHCIKFFLGLSLEIPSTILSLCIFVFFINNHVHLRKLQNQALLLLLIVNFVQLSLNIPMVIHFLRLNRVSPATGTYCRWWMYVEFTLDATNSLLVAILSIQRHILVFRPHILRIRLKRYIFYYLPLLFGVCYPMLFYMGTVVFYPCDDRQWNFTLNMCGDTICYLSSNQLLANFDSIVNTGSPIVVIMLANAVLVIRVIKQKYRRQQTILWSKQRRMTMQLLSISSLYLIAWLPTIVVAVLQQVKPSKYVYRIREDYLSDLTYLICLLLPWICIGLLPDFMKWMFKQFRRLRKQRNTVGIIT